MLQQQGKPDRQAWLCRCLRWAGWAGAGARAGGPPYLARPGLLRCVQQLRAEMPPTTARSPARAAALRAAAAGRSAEGRTCSFAAAARSSLPFDAVVLKGLLHITSVIRPWNPPYLTRRITHVMCPGDSAGRTRHCGGGHNSPFSAVYRCGPRPSLAATGSSALSAAVPERIERRQRSR